MDYEAELRRLCERLLRMDEERLDEHFTAFGLVKMFADHGREILGKMAEDHEQAAATAAKRVDALDVLSYLNEITGRHYRPVEANIRPIMARLREGYSVARLREIAHAKAQEWGDDPKMVGYLRPATLYNATKCAQYDGALGGDEND